MSVAKLCNRQADVAMVQKPIVGGKKSNRRSGDKSASTPRYFLYGIVGLLLALLIVFGVPAQFLKPTQVPALAVLLGLSGALITTGISGTLAIKTKTLVAGGPLAVFVLIFWAEMRAGA